MVIRSGDDGTRRELRLLIRLAIPTVALALVLLAAPVVASFSSLATIVFLAWLLAFLIHPLAVSLRRTLARLPAGSGVVLAYLLVGLVVAAGLAIAAGSLVESARRFSAEGPDLATNLAARLQPLQMRLDELGLGAIRLADAVRDMVNSFNVGASGDTGAIGVVAASAAGALGTLSIIVFMSAYMALERDSLRAGVRRAVPPRYHPHLTIVDEEVGRSFGGFVRGQVVMGIMYGAVAMVAGLVFNLPFVPLIFVSVAVLQSIPYFGPYVSWLPPVLIAVAYQPDATIPVIIIMLVAMVILANVIQPRIIGNAVGLSPLAVLIAVLVGGQVAGVLGAVFSVPFAAAALSIGRRLAALDRGSEQGGPEASAVSAAASPVSAPDVPNRFAPMG
jgi:predicted PurR-regulated permease PerM